MLLSMITKHKADEFIEGIWEYYHTQGRFDLPWRLPEPDGSFDPYKILVSEIMLQQTQVSRVIPKYESFLLAFPTVESLANAPLGDVVRAWQGLGYNRRAKFLHQAAHRVVHEYAGEFPHTNTELVKLPGVGKNTAGAIMAYAWDIPVVFVETNIRTVVIHHFFADQTDIPDTAIRTIMESVVNELAIRHESSREFYWAMMDYGTYIKQHVGNLNKLSKTYVKQSKFHGSNRQLRGALLRELAAGVKTHNMLSNVFPDSRLDTVLGALEQEGLIHRRGDDFTL
jgi:A/G-specific adenine glycosylase